MSEVNRYDFAVDRCGDGCPIPSNDGLVVYYEDYAALEQNLTDMAVQLANAESKCMELAAGHWPRLQEQDINALMRFNETCEDGEGYDIGAESMARLVEIGLAGKGPHGIRSITPFGQWVINAREGEVDLEPLKTEEDNIAESALRMAQLRTGAAQ